MGATKVGPHHLSKTAAVLDAGQNLHPKAMGGPEFYAKLDADHDGFKGCALIMQYSFEEAWPTWEMHPAGDEFVYLLLGDVDFTLRQDGEDKTVRLFTPGDYVVVPKGTWHTARPREPTTMLFVTPGEGTANEAAPPDDARRSATGLD